jgi:hypothetical protein
MTLSAAGRRGRQADGRLKLSEHLLDVMIDQ